MTLREIVQHPTMYVRERNARILALRAAVHGRFAVGGRLRAGDGEVKTEARLAARYAYDAMREFGTIAAVLRREHAGR